MNEKTYFFLTLFGGWLGLHKFATGKTKVGILYLCTIGLFCYGWLFDIIIAGIKLYQASKQKSANTYINSLYSEIDRNVANHEISKNYSSQYYSGLEEIESMWSVLYNLKTYNGEKANVFEIKCRQNISALFEMLEINKKYGFDNTIPPHVPSYVRLAMLYEKQERYEEAINVCVEAIRAGAINDGNKGKMYGRLARLIRKSGIIVSSDVLELADKS